ncbi:MAG: hypothetical protein JW889_02255 [Verrucomicrobia bacterium]|nr:hypothetical protein [Verrucomicrobiota bacterium]
MRWAIGFVVVVFCVVCEAGFAGEPPRGGGPEAGGVPEAAARPGVDLGKLDMAALMEMVRAEFDEIEGLRAGMETTLEEIEAINGEVAELRAKRLEQRLDEIAGRSPELEEAIQKLRAARTHLDTLRADLQQARESQQELFDGLELGREEKNALRTLLSSETQPLGPPEQPRDGGPQAPRGGPQNVGDRGGATRGGDQSDLAQRMRQQNERRHGEHQRRLEALAQQDPELHALLAKKAGLIDALAGPRVELAEHVQAAQRVIQELNRRFVEFFRLIEAGSEL